MNTFIGFSLPNWSNPELYWHTAILITIAYFIGSINFGKVLSLQRKKELSEVGSGNYGATNAGRAFGVPGFLIVFFGDFFKGVVAFWLMVSLVGMPEVGYVGPLNEGSVMFALFFVLVGHKWPIYWKFQHGGKGFAAAAGIGLVMNWYVLLLGALVFALFIFTTRRVSLASVGTIYFGAIMITFNAMMPASMTLYYATLSYYSMTLGTFVSIWLAAIFITYTHRKNLVKVFDGTESTVNGVLELRAWIKKNIILFYPTWVHPVFVNLKYKHDKSRAIVAPAKDRHFITDNIKLDKKYDTVTAELTGLFKDSKTAETTLKPLVENSTANVSSTTVTPTTNTVQATPSTKTETKSKTKEIELVPLVKPIATNEVQTVIKADIPVQLIKQTKTKTIRVEDERLRKNKNDSKNKKTSSKKTKSKK